MYKYVYIYMYTCVYVHVHVCMYVCMYMRYGAVLSGVENHTPKPYTLNPRLPPDFEVELLRRSMPLNLASRLLRLGRQARLSKCPSRPPPLLLGDLLKGLDPLFSLGYRLFSPRYVLLSALHSPLPVPHLLAHFRV